MNPFCVAGSYIASMHYLFSNKCVCNREQLKSHEELINEEERTRLQKLEKVYYIKLFCVIVCKCKSFCSFKI